MKNSRISIIGLGQVGMTFLEVLSEKNFEITSVFNRSEIESSIQSKYPKTIFQAGLPEKNDPLGDLIFLTVSDDAISEISTQLSRKINGFDGKSIVHCSGTHSSKVLEPFQEKGATVASFHPIKAITKKTSSFNNIWFDMEGDELLLTMLEELADLFGANSFRVEPEAKPFLHASAVVASNYLVVLADLVTKISAKGNIPEDIAIKALSPLMENTLSNIKELGVTDALTGPIARGDVQTIEKHLQSLDAEPGLSELYKKLGAEAVKIAVRKNGSSPSLEKIRKLLS
ncbi:MAG: DUF2520 domain-containing protein [Gracilimonas sp.]